MSLRVGRHGATPDTGDHSLGPVGRFTRMCFPTPAASFALALLVCLLAPAALIVVHIHENPKLSPIDEAQHWDYVTRLAHGGFPRMGQRLQPSTLRVVACRGTDLPSVRVPPCRQAVLRPGEFSGGGYQYEAQQPPLYYALTVPMRFVTVDVLHMGDLGGTRVTGIVWLCAGLFVLWTAGRALGMEPAPIGAAVLVLGSAPLVVYQSSTVTNGNSSILAGSLVVLLTALAWRHPGRWVVPVLALGGFAAVSMAEPNAMAVFVASVLVAVLALTASGSAAGGGREAVRALGRAWWPAGGALALGGLASAVIWIVVSRQLAVVNVKDLLPFEVLRTGRHGLGLIAGEAVRLLGPVTDSYNVFRPDMSLTAYDLRPVVNEVLRTLLLAGGLAGLFVSRRRWHHWTGLLSVGVLYVGGIVLGIGLWVTYDIDPALSGRYGMSLAPLLALGLVAAMRGRVARGLLWVVGVGVFVTTLGSTLVS